MKYFLKRTLLVLALLVYFSGACLSLEKKTHELINETIAKQPWLNNYLIANLGFGKGFEEKFNGKEIFKWIGEGGIKEDEPFYTRSFTHFHDPLKSWGIAGYKGIFTSSIVWAQDQEGVSPLIGGDQSWKKARDSFYKGLTGITTKTDREINLSDTFRPLGHVMHLVQDASVPTHVRNDTHVYIELLKLKIGYQYEKWVEENHKRLDLNPLKFDQSILNIKPDLSAPIPIANIFDTNKYNGLDDINVAAGTNIGLSEYSNANFFSEGTIFKDYPHPEINDTNYSSIDWKNPEIVDAEDGKLDNRIYIRKTVGEPVSRLASLSYISFDLLKKSFYLYAPLVLDDKVYEEYAQKLIPRAVGYSAGLLEYFFRGKLEVTPVESNKIKIINQSSENMDGIFAIYYDATDGNRKSVTGGSWSLLLSAGQTSSILTFNEPTDISEQGQFILVFKGQLGNESGAVVGKVYLFEKKFHWTIVVDHPNYSNNRYSWSYQELYWEDCGTTCGTEYLVTRTDNCPNEGSLKIYLLASDQYLENKYLDQGCKGNLTSKYIGQFKKEDILSKITSYQTHIHHHTVRQLKDKYNNFVCLLENGSVGYMMENYTISDKEGPFNPIMWNEISINSLEITKIKDDLYPNKILFTAYKPTSFSEVNFGRFYTNDSSFTYATTGWVFDNGYTDCNASEATTCCYSFYSEYLECFDVVGTIPGFETSYKSLKIMIPDIGFEFGPL